MKEIRLQVPDYTTHLEIILAHDDMSSNSSREIISGLVLDNLKVNTSIRYDGVDKQWRIMD